MIQITETVQDNFCWKRVWMTACAWWPRLRWEIYIMIALAAVGGLLGGYIDLYFNTNLGATLNDYICKIFIFMPAIFGMEKGRDMMRLLPAKNTEKGVFMLIYSLVILPVIAIGLSNLCYYGINPHFSLLNYISDTFKESDINIHSINFFLYISIASTIISYLTYSMMVLFIATKTRKNAVVKSIVFPVILSLSIGIIIGLVFGIFGFYIGYTEAISGNEVNSSLIASKIMNYVFFAIITMTILLFCALSVMLANYIRVLGRSVG